MVWDDPGNCPGHVWTPTEVPGGNGTGTSFHRNKEDAGRTRGGHQPGFCQLCNAWKGSLGLEPSPELYISHLVQIFREVRRVLRDDGTLWLNLGDSYVANGSGQVPQTKQHIGSGYAGPNRDGNTGLKPKNLIGIPWRVALALQADGWYLRSACPWVKASAMPESVKDRPTSALEYIFLLAKSQKYFFEAEAIKLKSSPDSHRRPER